MSSADGRFVLRVPKGILLSLLTLFVFLGLFEVGQRVYDHSSWKRAARNLYSVRGETADGHRFNDRGGAIVLRHHPYLVYETKANQRLPGVTVNAQGFRGRDWSVEKAPGSKRVIVMGGSAAFGQGASADDRVFSAVLERMMRDSPVPAGRTVEVYNAGVLGYNSMQEFLLLATRLMEYAPDALVLFDGWNDMYFGGTLEPGIQEAFHPIFYEFDTLLARNGQPLRNVPRSSAIFRMLERTINARRGSALQRTFGQFSDNEKIILSLYRLNLKRICRLARAHGVEVVIAPQPEVFQRAGTIPDAELERRREAETDGYAELSRTQYPLFIETAREVAAAQEVIFADFGGVFDATGDEIFVDRVHLNDRGNELIAGRLLPAVARALGFPAPVVGRATGNSEDSGIK